MNISLKNIVRQFQIEALIESVDSLGEGFISDTFLVKTPDRSSCNYILQRKNRRVFPDIPAMMQNIIVVTDHLKAKVLEQGGDPMAESMTILRTRDGESYYLDDEGEYWTMCVYIEDGTSYERVETPGIAYEGGRGIGSFHRMLIDLATPLAHTLPGFHDMACRFHQWDDALSEDRAGRASGLEQEIEWIENRREDMLAFWRLVEDGTIPDRVSHNDTKINNILFDSRGKALCMIDLDTVMNSTVLNDFGDAIRTYANAGAEDDLDIARVGVDMGIFSAFAEGYLKEARSFLRREEIENLAFSPRYITFEQVLRFLMDYINGDSYYKIQQPDHNLRRTRAQHALLRSMEKHYGEMQEAIRRLGFV